MISKGLCVKKGELNLINSNSRTPGKPLAECNNRCKTWIVVD